MCIVAVPKDKTQCANLVLIVRHNHCTLCFEKKNQWLRKSFLSVSFDFAGCALYGACTPPSNNLWPFRHLSFASCNFLNHLIAFSVCKQRVSSYISQSICRTCNFVPSLKKYGKMTNQPYEQSFCLCVHITRTISNS